MINELQDYIQKFHNKKEALFKGISCPLSSQQKLTRQECVQFWVNLYKLQYPNYTNENNSEVLLDLLADHRITVVPHKDHLLLHTDSIRLFCILEKTGDYLVFTCSATDFKITLRKPRESLGLSIPLNKDLDLVDATTDLVRVISLMFTLIIDYIQAKQIPFHNEVLKLYRETEKLTTTLRNSFHLDFTTKVASSLDSKYFVKVQIIKNNKVFIEFRFHLNKLILDDYLQLEPISSLRNLPKLSEQTVQATQVSNFLENWLHINKETWKEYFPLLTTNQCFH